MVRFVNFKIFIIKMKSVLSEVIKIELIKSVLSEGRVEDAKAKYPQDSEIVDYFVSQDPAGNNKYLPWMMKTYKQVPADAPQEVRTQAKDLISMLIRGFHQHSARLEKKDINQYKSLAELNSVISPLMKSSEEKAVKKEKEEKGVKKYYEDNDWLLIRPLTYESSCKYGANTKWCIASKDTSSHFKSYTKSGLLVFLIHKKSNHKFAFYTDQVDDTYIEIYNPLDTDIAGSGDISVKEFLQGLVDGEMQSYLDIDEEGFDEEDEWQLFKIKEDGTRKLIHSDYDLDDLIYEAVDKIWSHFFGRGSGKNTVEKFTRIFALFGYTLELGKKVKGVGIPWKILRSDGRPTGYSGDDFMEYFKSDIFDDFVSDEIIMSWDDDDLINFIRKNNLPFAIERDGVNNTSSDEDYSNIMSEEQAKSIYKEYSEIKKVYTEEKRNNDIKLMSDIIGRIKLKNNVAGAKGCLDKFDSDTSITNQDMRARRFEHCLSMSVGKPTSDIDIGLINPASGRALQRKLVHVWRLFQDGNGHGNYQQFIYDLFKTLLK